MLTFFVLMLDSWLTGYKSYANLGTESNLCVFENVIPKKIFRHKRYDKQEGENYKMRSLKKNEISEPCCMRGRRRNRSFCLETSGEAVAYGS
jgi:hypothetical protein